MPDTAGSGPKPVNTALKSIGTIASNARFGPALAIAVTTISMPRLATGGSLTAAGSARRGAAGSLLAA